MKSESIIGSTLVKMGMRVALVVLASTTLAFLHVQDSLEQQTLAQFDKYVSERGARERAIFTLAEANHQILKQAVEELLEAYGDEDPEARFSALFERQADGVTRNRADAFDGKLQPGVYIDDDLRIDADVRRRVLSFYDAISRFGPAWHSQFEDTYITTPDNIMVIYWPEVPTWAQDADTELYMPDEEYVWVADAEHNPERKTVWTGLFYDHVSKVWMVSAETPIYIDGRHIATIGHDITLNQLFDRTLNDVLPDSKNIIIREDGRLIAAPGKIQEIQDKEGYYDIASSSDPYLRSVLALTDGLSLPAGTGRVVENSAHNEYVAVTRIEEPGWYFLRCCRNLCLLRWPWVSRRLSC